MIKNSYKAIFFDLDGTLLPMDMEEFTSGYFIFLGEKLSPFGFEQSKLVKSIWAGTKAMAENDGSHINEEVFWNTFSKCMGIEDVNTLEQVKAACLDFYGNEFNKAKKYTTDNPKAVKAVSIAREKALKVILSTNPFFPMTGQETRMGWIGLKKEDFDLVTAYETDCFCKPNPKYFESVCKRMGLKPSECLLIGNDEYEDGVTAQNAGIDCYLVTDCLIENKTHHFNGTRGSFDEMLKMLGKLNID